MQVGACNLSGGGARLGHPESLRGWAPPRDMYCTCGAWWDPICVQQPKHAPDCAAVSHPDFQGKVDPHRVIYRR